MSLVCAQPRRLHWHWQPRAHWVGALFGALVVALLLVTPLFCILHCHLFGHHAHRQAQASHSHASHASHAPTSSEQATSALFFCHGDSTQAPVDAALLMSALLPLAPIAALQLAPRSWTRARHRLPASLASPTLALPPPERPPKSR
jgi:hypothetical protein